MTTQNFKLSLVGILVVALLMVQMFPIEGTSLLNYILISLLVMAMGSLSHASVAAKSQPQEKREKEPLTNKLSSERYTTQ